MNAYLLEKASSGLHNHTIGILFNTMIATLYRLVIFFFLILSCAKINAQNTALRLYTEGDSIHALSDFTGALIKFDSSRKAALREGDFMVFFDASGMLLDCLHKKLEIRKLEAEIDSMNINLSRYEGKMTAYHYSMFRDVTRIFTILVYKAYGDSEGALNLLNPLIDSLNMLLPSPDSMSIIIKRFKLQIYISEIYLAQGNYEQTLYYANEAIIQSKSLPNPDGWLLKPHYTLVTNYVTKGKTDEALDELNHILKLLPEIEQRQTERAVEAYLRIATLHLQYGSIDSAQYYLQLLKKIDNTGSLELDADILAGDIYYANKEYEKSKFVYLDMIQALVKKGAEESEMRAMCDLQLGKIAMKQDRPEDALGLLHSALLSFSEQFENPDPLSCPPSELIYSRLIPVEIIYYKSKVLYQLYHTLGDSNYLSASWQTVNLGIDFVNKLRNGYYDSEDKALLIEQSYRIFEHALHICHFQLSFSNNTSWVDTAFTLMERSKALNLMDAVMHQNARQFEGIPDTLLKTETALRMEISGQEASIQRLKSIKNYSKTSLRANISILREKENTYRALIEKIEGAYPGYYQLRYRTEEICLHDIQKLLHKDETVVEYFMAGSEIYTIVIEKNKKEFYANQNAKIIEDLVREYRSSIQACIDGDGSRANDSIYLNTAFTLYNALIRPAVPAKNSMIIVPDGVLNYLSFAGLLSEAPTQYYDFREQPYMLWDHEVSYCYSMSLYRELNQKGKRDAERSIVFAPEFDATGTLGQLTYNEAEARYVAEHTNAKTIVGTSCTVSAVRTQLQSLSGYRVAHFATHGVADVANGTDSYLQFAGPTDSNRLYARELYNYSLNADLVYLSACETGSGQLRRGEGIISIARAFFYAGTRSLVTALWSISDERAKDLTIAFYAHLMDGTRIDASVALAQRQYLERIPTEERYLAHPAYWSALIPIGSTSGIVPATDLTWILFLAGLALIFLVLRRFLMKSD